MLPGRPRCLAPAMHTPNAEAGPGRDCHRRTNGLGENLAPHPSLVIADFTMPRLNGLEVWEVLRRACPETPVIILTGQGRWGDPASGPGGAVRLPGETGR